MRQRLGSFAKPVLEKMDESGGIRRVYRNPPIEEALCEFRFTPTLDWEPTLPGRLQLSLDDYKGTSREQRAVQIGPVAQQGNGRELQLSAGLQRVQLLTPSGQRIIGVGPDVLSIHMLRPYSKGDDPCSSGGWKEFKYRIRNALTSYTEVVGQERKVSRVGLRYINRIFAPSIVVNEDKYLKCGLRLVDGLSESRVSFSSRAEYQHSDDMRLIVSYSDVDTKERDQAVLLDLDGIWQSQESVDAHAAVNVADELHSIVERAFEAHITEECRSLFDAI